MATTAGPQTSATWDRATSLVGVLTPALGAPGPFGWRRGVPDERLLCLLDNWLPRIQTDDNHDTVVQRHMV